MSYCLNSDCQKPASNPDGAKFCSSCGSKLLLKDRYRAIKLIGQGGFGKTFLALDEDKPSKPCCVIKQFFPQAQGISNAQKAAELFEKEAMRLDQLGKHPQIPELFAHFAQDSRQYLVQEFIDGQNLSQALAAEGAFRETQIRDLLKNLLPVLQFIHTHNIIHRDIKPENIIRRLDGQLVLVDFGAAKYATGTALAKTGTAIGSAGYASPEQTGGKAFFSSDLYSLGVTCIHLLTQVDPFELYSFSEDAWVWRDYLSTNVSTQLSCILDKLIERAIKRRYQSVYEVLKDLNLIEKENFSSRQVSPSTPPPVPPQYRKQTVSPGQPTATTGQASPSVSQLEAQRWRCINSLTGHSSYIRAVAISPDGQLLASCGGDKKIKIWQLGTGKPLFTLGGWLSGHSRSVDTIAFSPDGRILASGSADGTIKLWQLNAGKEVCNLQAHVENVSSIAFSPDGQILASGSFDRTIKLWHLGTRQLISTLRGHLSSVYCLAFSPDGQILASGSFNRAIKLWQMPLGKELTTFTGHTAAVWAIAFSPDGKTLVSGSWDKTIKIWDLDTGKETGICKGHLGQVFSIALSPDGQTLASGSGDGIVKIWQVATGKAIYTLLAHANRVDSIVFSPDGQTMVTGSRDKTIKIWRCD